MTTAMEVVRRRVPNDNSCLFYAIAYNCDPQQGQELLGVAKEDGDADAVTTADAATTEAKQQELRKVCARAPVKCRASAMDERACDGREILLLIIHPSLDAEYVI